MAAAPAAFAKGPADGGPAQGPPRGPLGDLITAVRAVRGALVEVWLGLSCPGGAASPQTSRLSSQVSQIWQRQRFLVVPALTNFQLDPTEQKWSKVVEQFELLTGELRALSKELVRVSPCLQDSELGQGLEITLNARAGIANVVMSMSRPQKEHEMRLLGELKLEYLGYLDQLELMVRSLSPETPTPEAP